MRSIAPTAQRLAEENNVDWRMLTGSGEGGSVVERDILGYLARVTRGEEATNPTPEPLPEGLTAWPEEPERRRGADRTANRATSRTAEHPVNRSENQRVGTENQQPAPFMVPAPVAVTKPTPDAETHTPWTVGKPAKAAPKNENSVQASPADFGISPAPEAVLKTVQAPTPPELETAAAPSEVPASSPTENSAAQQAALAELTTLRSRVAELEEERTRHVNELHQLSRLQETIALQKNEGSKLGAFQSEVRDLKAQLAAAQRAGERVEALAAHNRDLEARLVRARTFKSKARTEFERITEDNMMLEHELADLKKSRRGLFRKG